MTVTDAASSDTTGSQTVTVSPATAKTFALSNPASVTAGAGQSITLTVRDPFSNVAAGYRGTVRLTSSDPQIVPAIYVFTAADVSPHVFGVAETAAHSARRAIPRATRPHLTRSFSPSRHVLEDLGLTNASVGTAQPVVVSARDAYGNVATGYSGTVAFSSNDPAATLPSAYTFLPGDAGSSSFSVTLKSAGQDSVTAKDSTLSSSQTVTISAGPAVALRMTTALNQFEGSAVTTAGQTLDVILTAVDPYGNTSDRLRLQSRTELDGRQDGRWAGAVHRRPRPGPFYRAWNRVLHQEDLRRPRVSHRRSTLAQLHHRELSFDGAAGTRGPARALLAAARRGRRPDATPAPYSQVHDTDR